MTGDRCVLQIGDVAGVGVNLQRAIEMTGSWRSEAMPLPEHGAAAQPLVKAALLGPRAVQTWVAVERATRRVQPDVVHLHWARYAPFVRSRRAPLVVHAHGSDVRGRSTTMGGRAILRSLRRAALVLAATPDLLADLPAGARYLPNPVDTELFRPAPSRPKDRQRRVVFVFARLNPVKGAEHIVSALAQLRRQRPEVELRVVGGGAFDDAARRLGVTFVGPLDRSAVVANLRAADVVIGQQQVGSLGLSELEAMACGVPVIARLDPTRFPRAVPIRASEGADDIVRHCVELLDDPAASSALADAGRAYVIAEHSLGVVGRRLVDAYEALL